LSGSFGVRFERKARGMVITTARESPAEETSQGARRLEGYSMELLKFRGIGAEVDFGGTLGLNLDCGVKSQAVCARSVTPAPR
jgi:hypothetical protein